jgi:hydroxyacylglutathione hydrolase
MHCRNDPLGSHSPSIAKYQSNTRTGTTMPLLLETIACLSDNYAYLIHDDATGETALIDAPEVAPIMDRLHQKGWDLSQILITHHHNDHIDGVADIAAATGARILGAAADAHRLPKLDMALAEGDMVHVGQSMGVVMDVSGHTMGHIAFYFAQDHLVFTADSLMAGGCGRLFEGTAEVMWQSLQKLAELPSDIWVCSGHEYTASNLAFAASVDPENTALAARIDRVTKARANGRATVPSRLSGELATNPFLRADALKTITGAASDVQSFAILREMKNKFRG